MKGLSSCLFLFCLQVPVVALSLFGIFSAILTLLCDIHLLADFLSIGTLIAYTIVSMNVCILRYCQPQLYSGQWSELESNEEVSHILMFFLQINYIYINYSN